MEKNKFSSGVITVLIANIINLGFSILTSFLLPKFLSVETYATIKTFQLYVGYVGLLHLGYVDGMYIKNGGKKLSELSSENLSTSISTLRVIETILMAALIMLAVLIQDIVFIAFVLAIIPLNMSAYFQNLFSAVGEFKKYSSLVKATTFVAFAMNIFLVFVIRTDVACYYLAAYIVGDYCIWIILEFTVRKLCKTKFFRGFDLSELIENIKNGMLLTLGNLSSFLFTGMDRWFVKFFLPTADFAQYSFAVSIEHFVNATITPISVTLYNYFCHETNIVKIRKIRNYITIFSAAVVSVGFPAKFILENFLQSYISANSIIFLLFSAQIFYFPIKSVFVNLYKAQKKQKQYFAKLVIAIIAGFIFNTICYIFLRSKEAMAVGTVLAAIFWWAISLPDFKEIAYKPNELIFMFVELLVFNVCGFFLNSITGFLVYIIFTILMSVLLQKEDTLELLDIGYSLVFSQLKRS